MLSEKPLKTKNQTIPNLWLKSRGIEGGTSEPLKSTTFKKTSGSNSNWSVTKNLS